MIVRVKTAGSITIEVSVTRVSGERCDLPHKPVPLEGRFSRTGNTKTCKEGRSPKTPPANLGVKKWVLRALAHGGDALFEHIHSHVGFFLGHNQRRANPDRAGAASQQ